MAIGYLTERTQKIITMVLKRTSTLRIQEIAGELDVSSRTVYNELDKANSWLRMKKLPEIQNVRGKVSPFSEEEKAQIESVLEEERSQEDYIFTPSERTQMIVCQMITAREPVYVENLMNTCMVSRNTIFADLQAVISQLHTYQLGLGYEKKRGYWIDGDAVRVRALFFLYFNMLEPLVMAGKLNFLNMEEISLYLKRIEAIERELDVQYVRGDMLALAAMLPVMECGDAKLYFLDVSTDKVRQSREYALVEKHFPELSETEQIYLTLHFLGGRLASYSRDSREEDTQTENEFVLEISRNLVTEFERRACVVFEQKEELIRELYRHISASIYRYRFGIQIGNPMADDIKREYPYIFDAVRVTVQYLEQQIGVRISDSEVAYLALHFGAHLEYAKQDEKELRILVVCMNGVATGNMISHELKRILPKAKIVGVMAASKIVNPQRICDVIITSAKVEAIVPVIVVNPILNDFDRKNILNHPLIRGKYGFVDTDALLKIAKKYVYPEKYNEFKHELEKFLIGQQEEKQPVLNPDVWKLTDFLTEDRIVFLNSDGSRKYGSENIPKQYETDWERAIYTTALPLIRRGSISEKYVTCIIDRLMEAGPYMFVTKDLVLAHARPQDGVRHLDIAIGISTDGILFESGKRARIVFCLVVEDQQKHIGILKDIRKVLSKETQIDELVKIESAGEICEKLYHGLEEH